MNCIVSNGINIGKKIEAPISAFNNVLLQISSKIESIYLGNKNHLLIGNKKPENHLFINQLLFDNKSITIFNCVKIFLINDEINFKFCGNYDSKKMHIVQKTCEHSLELKQIFQQYLFLVSSVTNNFDDSVSQKYIETLFEKIYSGNIDPNKIYLIPYKNKIKHLYDSKDPVLDKLYNRYSYVMRFKRTSKTFTAKMFRVLSSELDENKSLDNIRFEEIELIKEATIPIDSLKNFLVELFYYGNFNY